ncbi:MAG: M23 family metallopeptidase [Treponema sp.]|nr:M23 family metallopeptidase [Treponema sp.]
MEIVSYVGYDESHAFDVNGIISSIKNKFHSSNRRHEKRINEYKSEGSFPEIDFSGVRSICKSTGQSLTFLWENKIICAYAFAFLLSLALIIKLSFSIYTYTQTFPSRIVLKDSYDSELELLNKAMTSFALEEGNDYTSEGDLIGVNKISAKDMEKLFQQPVTFQTYKVQSGDTISGITKKFGLNNISTLIAVNDIGNVRTLCAGQKLKIPSIDGLYYTVQSGNSLAGLSSKFNISMEDLLDVNELDSAILSVGQRLFIPGAKMDSRQLQQAMGELFKCPIVGKYRISSYFGPRKDPFTGARSNHTGVDYACPTGTPIIASSSGTVAFTGVSPVFGNYVIIRHSNGYQTLYGHMSKILTRKGQWVSQGTRIGLVGSTGYSTGPHLHFTVFKNGKLVDPLSLAK